jgi:hypothetical protein
MNSDLIVLPRAEVEALPWVSVEERLPDEGVRSVVYLAHKTGTDPIVETLAPEPQEEQSHD